MTTAQILYDLEMDFMKADFCRDKERLAARFSDDFIEFGQSGRVLTKPAVVDALSRLTANRKIHLSDFCVRPLPFGAFLVTYQAHEEDNGRKSSRSSIWEKDNGQWKLVFHQGTTSL